jgi:PAS domain S-box-containing protein
MRDPASSPDADADRVDDVFKEELRLVEHAEAVSHNLQLSVEELRQEYAALVKEYKRLARQSAKLTRISDGNEKRLLKAQHQLSEAEVKYRTIYEQTFEGLYQISLEGLYIHANSALLRLYGVRDLAALNAFFQGGADQEETPERKLFLAQVKQAQAIQGYESEVVRADGEPRWIAENIRLVTDNADKPSHYEGSAVDITDRKKVEHALHEAKNTAELVAEAKSQFLATMSHEIRTPMNGVLGMCTMLMQTELNHDQAHYANVVKQSAEALLVILNDILDFSKIEAGKLELESIGFNLVEPIQGVTELLGPTAKAKGIQLLNVLPKEMPRAFRGDPFRLRQILMNLIGNAVKFTETGSVTVEVEVLSQEGETARVEIRVRDTGVGISPEGQARLFQAFSQADTTTTRKFGGTGLGLAICLRLAELMGGQIGVHSVVGEGSVFWLQLPLGIEDATPVSTGHGEKRTNKSGAALRTSSRKLKLLLVDDSATNREVGQLILERMGHHIVTAADGLQALTALEQQDFDTVLMDCEMPELDGYEATRRIRSGAAPVRNPRIPIVAMTAWAMLGDKERCFQAGMDDYVGKPIDLPTLHQVLENCIKRIGEVATVGEAQPAPRARERQKPRPRVKVKNTMISVSVVEAFLEEMPGRLLRLEKGWQTGDWKDFAHVCHTLRGTLTLFGSDDFVALIAHMERQARLEETDGLPVLMESARMTFGVIEEELKKKLANVGNAEEKEQG